MAKLRLQKYRYGILATLSSSLKLSRLRSASPLLLRSETCPLGPFHIPGFQPPEGR